MCWNESGEKYGFVVAGYVVMPEHIHLLVNEPQQSTLDQAIKAFKLSVTLRRSERPFWQARYYGFAFWQLDTGLTRDFRVDEKAHVQFCAEAFNVLNRTPFGDPQTNISSGSFGVINSTLPARELQMAAKIIF